MPKLVHTCDHCRQPYTPSPRHAGRQKYCTRKLCRRDRRRKTDAASYRRRCALDVELRADCAKRVRRHRQRLKVLCMYLLLFTRPSAPSPPPVPGASTMLAASVDRLLLAVTGLASQLGGEGDPTGTSAVVDAWVDRGARMMGNTRCPAPETFFL